MTCGPGANADSTVPPAWPGLPAVSLPSGWVYNANGSWGDGLSEVARARQWIKIPAQAVAVQLLKAPATKYPADDPQGRISTQDISVSLFLSSPAGAKDGYGIGLPTTVRTVAFGAIPIQADVQLEQLRNSGGLPVPLQLHDHLVAYQNTSAQQVRPGFSSAARTDITISGKVRVRLTALSVDGVDMGLRDCVSAPIDLDLKSGTMWAGDPLTDVQTQSFPEGSTAANTWQAVHGVGTLNGGAVSGDIDIPAFSHCLTTSGEDLSPLLTNSISGPGNPVTVGYASISAGTHTCSTVNPENPLVLVGRGPFRGDPSDCDPDFGPPTLDYPERGR